jgi:hypothetical protein
MKWEELSPSSADTLRRYVDSPDELGSNPTICNTPLVSDSEIEYVAPGSPARFLFNRLTLHDIFEFVVYPETK